MTNLASRLPNINGDRFAEHMESVAKELLGDPNPRLSKPNELRYGTDGSLSVDIVRGVFFDFERNRGGGVIDLVTREIGLDFVGARKWLEARGYGRSVHQRHAPRAALRSVPTQSREQSRTIAATYHYLDESGALLSQAVRYKPKSFKQRRPCPNEPGIWIWGLNSGEYMRRGPGRDWVTLDEKRFTAWPSTKERKKFDAARRVLYQLSELIEGIAAQRMICIPEGERDVDNLRDLGFVATTNAMGAGKWESYYNETLRGADVVIISDNDKSGREHAQLVAASLYLIAKRVRLLDLAQAWPECPEKGDISDWIAAGGTADQLKALTEELPDWEPREGAPSVTNTGRGWREPKDLPTGLLPVDPFDLDFMPDALKTWIDDVANRLQCPPDYVAVTAIVALGSVIGRRVGIKPQLKTDWVEVPNIWGGFIGRPGMLKSPAMQEALKPLHRLEAEAEKENEVAREAYAAGMSAYKVRQQVKIALEKEALKKAKSREVDVDFDLGEEPKEPVALRYRTNDSSYEALGELLRDNPAGVLIERDELMSLLKHLGPVLN
jgi:hypothetical protein